MNQTTTITAEDFVKNNYLEKISNGECKVFTTTGYLIANVTSSLRCHTLVFTDKSKCSADPGEILKVLWLPEHDELTTLRSQVETLTRERDEALSETKRLQIEQERLITLNARLARQVAKLKRTKDLDEGFIDFLSKGESDL